MFMHSVLPKFISYVAIKFCSKSLIPIATKTLFFKHFIPFKYKILLQNVGLPKFVSCVATEYSSKRYKSNSIAKKTLSTQLWYHWLAFCTKFF